MDLQNASKGVELFVIGYQLLVLTVRSTDVHHIFGNKIELGRVFVRLTNNE